MPAHDPFRDLLVANLAIVLDLAQARDVAAALESYWVARERVEADLGDELRPGPAGRYEGFSSVGGMGMVFLVFDRELRREKAVRAFDEIVEVWRAGRARSPWTVRGLRDLALGIADAAWVRFRLGRGDDARVRYDEALELQRALVERCPEHVGGRLALARILGRAGDALLRSWERRRAEDLYLDEEKRTLMLLRLEQELSFREIADRLGLPSADAARKRYARCIALLRTRWQG